MKRLTLSEQQRQLANRRDNPVALVSGMVCPCGRKRAWKRPDHLYCGDSLDVECECGRHCILQFVGDTR